MLDPLTALGAAGNIVQFVDFSSKIVSSCYSTYRSVSGATEDHVHLEKVTSELRDFSDRLKTYQDAGYLSSRDPQEVEELRQLAGMCHIVADGLANTLDKLKVVKTGPLRTWDAVRKALQSARKETAIEHANDKLQRIQAQLSLRIMHIIRVEQSSVRVYLAEIQRNTKEIQKEHLARITASNQALQTTMVRQARSLEDLTNVIQAAHLASTASDPNLQVHMSSIITGIDAAKQQAVELETKLRILSSLHFPEMQMRHSDIHDAYRGTTSWIFDRDSDFKVWLEQKDGLFWVNGKAGSGKSTLIKYICDHPDTEKLLGVWAGRKHTVGIASWYFWNAGYPVQKTQLGLLQSLLFQMLRRCPDLIPDVLPDRWAASATSHDHPDPWTRRELLSAFSGVLQHPKLSTRFCFFIDGLDEYEGDHYTLIQELQELVDTSSIKLCVSSRPWNAFTSAYGHLTDRQLVLQNHSQEGMRAYVQGMLEQDPRFARLSSVDPNAQDLVTEIQERAQGVFLWVFLVVRSLLRGLTEADDIAMLQKRMRQLPTDLERFFQQILDSVDDVYQEYTARTLLIVLEAHQPLSMLAFWYLDVDLEKPNYLLRLVIRPLADGDVDKARVIVTSRLNKWCRDLLEVNWNPSPGSLGDVAELTVRDFLFTGEVYRNLLERAGQNFIPSLATCRLYLALAKWLRPARHADGLLPLHRITEVMMRSARAYEERHHDAPYLLLDDLDRVGRTYDPNWCAKGPSRQTFVALAARHGLDLYVKHAIDQQNIPATDSLSVPTANGRQHSPSGSIITLIGSTTSRKSPETQAGAEEPAPERAGHGENNSEPPPAIYVKKSKRRAFIAKFTRSAKD
ncbi:hypothetical protein LTR56_010358 [Elasticomyces elasticus]|nr:hypothetical protein LTR56_010358 [Elasticomyces elasticus]KAK3656926.1 hypothetical protein LTR22_009588 [Elasticomyces elasticus]KAK4926071.1 hypothetical protein LTR49_006986 [Elasticomyces elasticus]KAK5766158.1 hypothetical protein LTS12_003641 [Elasticomyces elasticus]